jgi:hypothetical protein
MSDQNLVADAESTAKDLLTQFQAESEKKQLQMIPQFLEMGETGLTVLKTYLEANQDNPPTVVMGKVYQTLQETHLPEVKEFLVTCFPNGVVTLHSERNVDYQPLQDLLIQQEYQAADKLTLEKMCELAGESATERGWLYFTEVENFPIADLHTIDQLWRIYSEGKFGFSVQQKLWRSVGQDFSKLWYKIAWKERNIWTRYPTGFIWDLTAPIGHLPLSNQLRGVRSFASLMAHPAWTKDQDS